MDNKLIIDFFMKMVNPDYRNSWDFTKWHFENVFKYPLTQEEWQVWMEENNAK